MAGPLKVNIPTFKPIESPYQPDFGKSLASLMQAYSSMARAQAAASGGGSGGIAGGKGYYAEFPNPADPNNPIRVPITGASKDIRDAVLEQAQRKYLTDLLASDQTIANKLANIDKSSAKKAKETLDDIRKNDLKRIKEFTGGMDARKILDVMLAPHKAKVDERLKAIDDDPWWNVLGQKIASEGEVALKNLGSFMSPNDAREDIAHGEEINRIRKEAEDNSAYLREQALRASEDEGWWSRSDGLSGLILNSATTVAEAVPNVGVAIAAPVVGTAVAGPAGTVAGVGVAGGFNAAAQRGEFLARVAADPNLTYEQKLAAAEEGETYASGLGFATGAVPFSVGKAASKVVGKLPGKAVTLPVSRALNPETSRGVGTALADTAMAALEGGTMSGTEMALQNVLYDYTTGLDTPWYQNVGDAILMGAIGGAPFGAVQTFARPSVQQTPSGPIPELPFGNIPTTDIPEQTPIGPVPSLGLTAAQGRTRPVPMGTTESTSSQPIVMGMTVPDTPEQRSDNMAAPIPVGPIAPAQLYAAQGRNRPIPMGTETPDPSRPIAMGMAVPDTPEQRLYNALATINKSDKDYETKLKQAVLAYGQEGGTVESLAAFAQQARLSNKKLAELPQDQKLFVGSKLTNAPLKELNDLVKLAETDDSILGANQNVSIQTPIQTVAEAAPERADAGSSQTPAVASVGPDGLTGTDPSAGANLVVDSGVAAPVAAPVTDPAAGTVGPIVGSDRAVESGGISGAAVQAESANQVPQVVAEPTGVGAAVDTGISGPDNRLVTGSGEVANTSAGIQPDTGRGSSNGTTDAANAGGQQQPTGRAGLDPQAFDQRPADMPRVDVEGSSPDATPAKDVTTAIQRLAEIGKNIKNAETQRLIRQNTETADDLGVYPYDIPETVVQDVPEVKVKERTKSESKGTERASSKNSKSTKPVAEASEYDVLTAINSLDPRVVPARDRQRLTTLLYKEALGEKLTNTEQKFLNKARSQYDLPRISKFNEPDLAGATTIHKLVNMLPPEYWNKHVAAEFSSAGDALYVMRNGRTTDDWNLARRYDYIVSTADKLQDARIKDQLSRSSTPYKMSAMTREQSALLYDAKAYGLPDIELPPNLDTAMQSYARTGGTADPVIMTRALMDPEGAHAKVLQRQLCPPK